ncbi:hypothetical protein [Corallococcus carmarthensis]|uniref:Endonuclease/exonuclease/phosphatase domain-containing protein n=2 Tax=Corallococcus carmarthensis TaxID=2316728 RepID=A0A3A8KJK5_9BACT|nr:hypothetical protein [Corallococcus carmarthensis]RKH07537.1 hypothetical protein D7X32_01890 [Corallococcus carmarthensis]
MKEGRAGTQEKQAFAGRETFTLRSGQVLFHHQDRDFTARAQSARKQLQSFSTQPDLKDLKRKRPQKDTLQQVIPPYQPPAKRRHLEPKGPVPLEEEEELHLEPGLDLGVGTFNLNHFGEKTAEAKQAILVQLFERNPWLDVLVLQEVNKKGLPLLKAIDFASHGLTLVMGPQMQAVYPKYKGERASGEGEEDDDGLEDDGDVEGYRFKAGDGDWTLGKSQNEWYPIICRNSSRIQLRWRAFNGAKVTREDDSDTDDPIQWAKPVKRTHEPSGWKTKYPLTVKELVATRKLQYQQLNTHFMHWRPVVVYDLVVNGDTRNAVHIGVVHTSPAGKGLGRKGEYEQVSGFFEHIAQELDTHWIIAGDYYVDPEATLKMDSDSKKRQWSDLFHVKADELGLELAVTISATNQTPLHHRSVSSKKNKESYEEKGYVKDWAQVEGRFMLNKRADFFVISRTFALHHTGIFSPVRGLLPVDPNHHALNWWAKTSDHAPTGGIFCTTPFSRKWAENRQLLTDSLRERQSRAEFETWELQKQAVDALLFSLRQVSLMVDGLPQEPRKLACQTCVLIIKALNTPAAVAIRGAPFEPEAQDYSDWKAGAKGVTDQHLSEFFGLCSQAGTSLLLTHGTPLDEFARAFRNAYRAIQQVGIRPRGFDLTPEAQRYDTLKPGARNLPQDFSLRGGSPRTRDLEEGILKLLRDYLQQQKQGGTPTSLSFDTHCIQGSLNQFQVPGGRTACSAMAVLAIAAMLSKGLDSDGIDHVLLEGTALYQRMLTDTEDEALLMEALALSCNGVVDPRVLQPQAPYYNPLEIPEEEITRRGLRLAGAGTVHVERLGEELASILKQHPRVGVALVMGGYTVALTRNDDAFCLFDSHGWKDRRNAFVQRFTFSNVLLELVGKMVRKRTLFDPEVGVTLYLPEDG